MSPPLDLDTRQRAMLDAMGIAVWLPAPAHGAAQDGAVPQASAVAAPPPSSDAASDRAAKAGALQPPQGALAQPSARPAASPQGARALQPPPAALAQPGTASPSIVSMSGIAAPARPAAAPRSGTAAAGWTLARPRLLFPQADPAAVPPGLGAGWLIVAEPAPVPVGATPGLDGGGADPFAGDAGRLLANMLRAMQLHRHPRVFLAPLVPADGAAAGTGAAEEDAASPTESLADRLAAVVAETRPAFVLVMGRLAAQALLRTDQPLGRLRGALVALPGLPDGLPALITYDAPYLLRAQPDKARAWADLCLALATVAGPGQPAG